VAEVTMEALPVELMGVILSHVDDLTLPCCYAVSHRWTAALRHHRGRPAGTVALPIGKKDYCWRLAREGRLALLKWAHSQGCPWSEGTCTGAAEGGHLEVLQWAHANGCPWDWPTCA
jgi:hypothetical protein